MNPEIKTQWLAALRSGDYVQGRGYLSQNGEFCCLGVLADLAVRAGVVETCGETEWAAALYGAELESFVLPREVIEWAGIEPGPNDGTLLTPVDGYDSLWELNDKACMPFNEIAAVIEEQF